MVAEQVGEVVDLLRGRLQHRLPGVAQQSHLVPEVLAAFAQVVDRVEAGRVAERGERFAALGVGGVEAGGEELPAVVADPPLGRPGRDLARSPRPRHRPRRPRRRRSGRGRRPGPRATARSPREARRRRPRPRRRASPASPRRRGWRRGAGRRRAGRGSPLEVLLAELVADQPQGRPRLLQVFAGPVDRLRQRIALRACLAQPLGRLVEPAERSPAASRSPASSSPSRR